MFENAVTFDRDLSPWEVTGAVDMDRMLYNASMFSQYLCPWMDRIPETASVSEMFVMTSCPNQGDPDLSVMPVNPLCYDNCTLDMESASPSGMPTSGGAVPAPPTPALSPTAVPPAAPTSGAMPALAIISALMVLMVSTVWNC